MNLFKLKLYRSFYLNVDTIHKLFIQCYGNKNGIPIFLIHGGPGGFIEKDLPKICNPNKFNIICFDQRGCGKSKPFGELKDNKTQFLIEDIEKIRKYFNFNKISLYGKSWGASLVILYSQKYPENINKIVISGFNLYNDKFKFTYGYSNLLKEIYPDNWKKFIKDINIKNNNSSFLKYYFDKITNSDLKISKNIQNNFLK